MSDTLTHDALAVLRAICLFDKASISTLSKTGLFDSTTDGAMRAAVISLRGQDMLRAYDDDALPFVARQFSITPKGRRALRRADEADQSRIALPRKVDMHTTWDGRWLTAPVRAGALDAFTLPSLRGDERVPHATPVSLAGSVNIGAGGKFK